MDGAGGGAGGVGGDGGERGGGRNEDLLHWPFAGFHLPSVLASFSGCQSSSLDTFKLLFVQFVIRWFSSQLA